MKKKKDNRGGARLGAGAKSLYGEKTKFIGFNIPLSSEPEVRRVIAATLVKYHKL